MPKIKFSVAEVDKLKLYLSGQDYAYRTWMDDRKYSLSDGLIYVGDLRVVPVESRMQVIGEYFKDPRYAGGRDALYDHIHQLTLGITKSAVAEVLKKYTINQ